MLLQLRFFWADYKKMTGRKKSRMLYLWMSRQAVGIGLYRFERGMFLTFGKAWQYMRILLLPILSVAYAYGNCEMNYHANIGPGIMILHSSLGIVVSGKSTIGAGLVMTGGNVIGIRSDGEMGKIFIGSNCRLGANAVVIGPVTLGNNVTIGASACVVKDAPEGAVLAGVPAKNLAKQP